MTSESPNPTARGIEIMAAWTESSDGRGTDFALSRLTEMATEDGERGLVDASIGLANVAGYLLLMLERETGKTPQQALQEIAKLGA
ncbi:hypothetical protein [Kitasatospora sp. NPDC001225]